MSVRRTAGRTSLGIGWRPEIALAIDRRRDLDFVELLAEDFDPRRPLPDSVTRLQTRGVAIVPHGVSLSLGGAEPPDPHRLERLAALAEQVGAPLVSEHVAFVRAGRLETGHLLPVPLTRESLDTVVANVRQAQAALPVPLALENIASLFVWPDAETDDVSFLTELLDRTGALLLLDVANVYANARNRNDDPGRFLDRIPLERIAYVHVAGGLVRNGLYHDTHGQDVPSEVLDLLAELCSRGDVPGAMLERDDGFPHDAWLNAELDAIAAAAVRGRARRLSTSVPFAASPHVSLAPR